MKYAIAGAFRAALDQRLNTSAQQTGVPLIRLRKLVVFDRLMARLMVVAPDRWVLKGAVALHYRVGPNFRTTKDMDLGRYDSEQAATADFLAVQSVDLSDHFTFGIRRTGKLDQLLEGAAVRYHVTAELAGRPFEYVTVDIGFGDPSFSEPELMLGPDLLSFAGIPPAMVPVLSLEQHIAEKVHAYSRSYAADQISSRVKDLVDLVVIASLFSLRAGQVRQALDATFVSRGTHSLPSVLDTPPTDWRVPYRRMAADAGLDPDMAAGYEAARAFLDPLLGRLLPNDALWDPTQRSW